MSKLTFSEHLYGSFELVDDYATQRRIASEEFMRILKERASIEEAYGKGMHRLSEHSFHQFYSPTLTQALSSLKNYSRNKTEQSKSLVENITHDLLDPFKDLLKSQSVSMKKSQSEAKKLEKTKRMLLDKCEKAKDRYWKACNEYEQLTLAVESYGGQAPPKLIQKHSQSHKEVEVATKAYQECVADHNIHQKRYDELMPKILEVYQQHEEQRLHYMKNALRKLIVYETSYLRSLQYDIDSLAYSMESVNVNSDIQQFISDHEKPKPEKTFISFEPYTGTHQAFQNLGQEPPKPDTAQKVVRGVPSWLQEMMGAQAILKARKPSTPVPSKKDEDVEVVYDSQQPQPEDS